MRRRSSCSCCSSRRWLHQLANTRLVKEPWLPLPQERTMAKRMAVPLRKLRYTARAVAVSLLPLLSPEPVASLSSLSLSRFTFLLGFGCCFCCCGCWSGIPLLSSVSFDALRFALAVAAVASAAIDAASSAAAAASTSQRTSFWFTNSSGGHSVCSFFLERGCWNTSSRSLLLASFSVHCLSGS